MAYSLVTRTTLPSFSAPELTVKRRFKDFVALSDLLQVCGTGQSLEASGGGTLLG